MAPLSPAFALAFAGPSIIPPIVGPVVDTTRYMFFATRNKVPSGNVYAAPANGNFAGSRIVFGTPEYETDTFTFHWSGFSGTEGGNSPQETQVPGNDTVIDEAYLYANTSLSQLLFGGLPTVTIPSGDLGAWCDDKKLSQAVPAESQVTVITKWHTASTTGNFIPVYRWQAHRGEKAWCAASLAELTALVDADAPSSAPFAANYGTLSQLAVYGPDFMVAKGKWPVALPVALVVNDSLLDRQEFGPNADARGNMGYVRKWLDKKGGIGRIPFFPIGMPGSAAFRELTGSGATIATRRWDILDQIKAFNGGRLPFTTIINQLGQNDTTTPYATWLSRLTAFAGSSGRLRTRYPGVKIVQIVPIGRTSNSIEYKDVAAVTYAAYNAFPADGTDNSGKWRLRNDIIAKTSGICDDYIDTLDAWQGVAGVGKPPMYDEFGWSSLTEQAGTDGTATYNTFKVADASPYQKEQQLRVYSADGATLLGSGNIIIDIVGNTLTIQTAIATVYPVGARLYQIPVNYADGLHLMPATIRRMVDRLPQADKAKLIGSIA